MVLVYKSQWLFLALILMVALIHPPPSYGEQPKVKVTWLGHASFKIVSPGGKIIYIDPWLTNPKAPPGTAQVDKADLVLLTHGHFDHAGSVVEIANKTGAKLVALGELGRALIAQGLAEANLIGMNKGGTVTPLGPGIKITMVKAEHSSGVTGVDPATGKPVVIYGGEPTGFVVTLENGFTFYYAGDTDLFGDMQLIGEMRKLELAFLPIGGHFTMDPVAAARAVNMLKPLYVIPMHYGTYPILKGNPEELRKALGEAPVKVIVPSPGETVEF